MSQGCSQALQNEDDSSEVADVAVPSEIGCRTGSRGSCPGSQSSRRGSRSGSRGGPRGSKGGSSRRGPRGSPCADVRCAPDRPSTAEGGASTCGPVLSERPSTVPWPTAISTFDDGFPLQLLTSSTFEDAFPPADLLAHKRADSLSEISPLPISSTYEDAFPAPPHEEAALQEEFAQLLAADPDDNPAPPVGAVRQSPDNSLEKLSEHSEGEGNQAMVIREGRRNALTQRRKSVGDMLGVPMLCGLCPPTPAHLSTASFPSGRLHVKLRESLQRCGDMTDIDERFYEQLKNRRATTIPQKADFESFKVASLPERSVFSQAPHRKIKTWSCCKAFEFDAKMLQYKVKEPWLREMVRLKIEDADGVRELRAELEKSTIRMIVAKPVDQRTFEEKVQLTHYLRKHMFFKDLHVNLVGELIDSAMMLRFESGAPLYQRGEHATGVHIVLKGSTEESDFQEPEESSTKQPSQAVRRRASVNFTTQRSMRDFTGAPLLGIWDVFEEWVIPPQAREDPRHRSCVTAVEDTETIFVPATRIIELLEEEKLNERLQALQEFFPATKGMPKEELFKESKVKCDGRNLLVHELFQVDIVRIGTTFYEHGHQPPYDEALIITVLEGKVKMRDKGSVVSFAEAGAVLGDEALTAGQRYKCTAVSFSLGVRVLAISASDYVREFQGGKLKIPPRVIAVASADEPSLTALQKLRRTKARRVNFVQGEVEETCYELLPDEPSIAKRSATHTHSTRHFISPIRAAADHKELMETEWKALQPKKLPACVAPPSAPTRQKQTCSNAHLQLYDPYADSAPIIRLPSQRRSSEEEEHLAPAKARTIRMPAAEERHHMFLKATAPKGDFTSTFMSQASTTFTTTLPLSDGSGDDYPAWPGAMTLSSLPSTAGGTFSPRSLPCIVHSSAPRDSATAPLSQRPINSPAGRVASSPGSTKPAKHRRCHRQLAPQQGLEFLQLLSHAALAEQLSQLSDAELEEQLALAEQLA